MSYRPTDRISSLKWGTIVVLISALATLLFTCVSYTVATLAHDPAPLSFLLVWHGTKFYLWASCSPLIVMLARRWPMDRSQWPRRLLLHLALALLWSLVITTAFVTVIVAYSPWKPVFSGFAEALQNWSIPFSWGVLIYWSILLATNAIDNNTRCRREKLRNSQVQTALAQAQLQALRLQLEPHFLFNTLHSISDLVLQDAEKAVEMIARLGDFLRFTLDGPKEEIISLRQELEFVRSYLEVEQVRFHDQLEISIAAEPQTYAARVPNLILQPIVENAVQHGIRAQRGHGRIHIATERRGDRLHITVQDNGPGIEKNGAARRDGLGLANTRARLTQLYAEEQSLEFSKEPPQSGTLISLTIPFTVGELPSR